MTDPVIDLLFYAIIFCGLFMTAFTVLIVVSPGFRREFLDEIRKSK